MEYKDVKWTLFIVLLHLPSRFKIFMCLKNIGEAKSYVKNRRSAACVQWWYPKTRDHDDQFMVHWNKYV